MSFSGPSGSSIERRQQQRKVLRTNAELLVHGSTQPVVARTIDISVAGLGVVAAVNPAPGSTCMIRIAAPAQPRGETTIVIHATVTHSIFTIREDGFVIGLRFNDLSAEAVQAVTKFLDT